MLVLVVGVWAVIAGLVEIAAAFQAGEQAGTRALFILGGWHGRSRPGAAVQLIRTGKDSGRWAPRGQMGAAWMVLGVIDVHDDLQVTG